VGEGRGRFTSWSGRETSSVIRAKLVIPSEAGHPERSEGSGLVGIRKTKALTAEDAKDAENYTKKWLAFAQSFAVIFFVFF
jgi:hypothetical protein